MTKRFEQNTGPSQRQQRVAELVRHALSEVLARGDIQDDVITRHVITIPEVRMSPDLKLATAYVMPLGGKDEQAVLAALEQIAQDAVPRGVNLSPASLADSGFVPRLRAHLLAAPAAAQHLWLEVAESAALERFELVRELCKQLRPLGVRIGLEHAGERLARIEFLFEAGLDYVKLDASVVQGIAHDTARAAFVTGTVNMLRSLGLHVYAEGVSEADDLQALWPCGVDGATGPGVKLAA